MKKIRNIPQILETSGAYLDFRRHVTGLWHPYIIVPHTDKLTKEDLVFLLHNSDAAIEFLYNQKTQNDFYMGLFVDGEEVQSSTVIIPPLGDGNINVKEKK